MPTRNTVLTAGRYSKAVAYPGRHDGNIGYALNCMLRAFQDNQAEPKPVNSQVAKGGVAGFYDRFGKDWMQKNKSLGTDRTEVTGFDGLRPCLTGLDIGI